MEPSSKLVLLTGFGPFGSVKDNPSGRIIKGLAKRLEKELGGKDYAFDPRFLEVRPGIIDEIPIEQYEKIISIGVAVGLHRIRVETTAVNYHVDPDTGKTCTIDSEKPPGFSLKGGALPANITRPAAGFQVKLGGPKSAGTYVCNDTFYRICRRKTGAGFFIHIPNVAPNEDKRLTAGLAQVACRILCRS